jgi:hypothetical protein
MQKGGKACWLMWVKHVVKVIVCAKEGWHTGEHGMNFTLSSSGFTPKLNI